MSTQDAQPVLPPLPEPGHLGADANYGYYASDMTDYARAALAAQQAAEPVPMVLHCPKCGAQHIDAPDNPRNVMTEDGWDEVYDWANPPHRSHLCHACGTIWRPADVPTTGVASINTKGKADNFAGHAPATPPPVQPPEFREALRETAERSKAAPAGTAVPINPAVSAEFRKFSRGEPSAFDALAPQAVQPPSTVPQAERTAPATTDANVIRAMADQMDKDQYGYGCASATLRAYADKLGAVQPQGELGDERTNFVRWLSGSYPTVYSPEHAEHWWEHNHVSALSWRAALASRAVQPMSDEQAELVEALDEAAAKVRAILKQCEDDDVNDPPLEFTASQIEALKAKP